MHKLYSDLTFGDAVNVLARVTNYIRVHFNFCDGGYVLNSEQERNNRRCAAMSFSICTRTQNPVDYAIRDRYADCLCEIWSCDAHSAEVEVFVELQTEF